MSDGVWWPEFEQWMLAHGLDPNDVAELAWRPGTSGNFGRPQCIEALVYLRSTDGHRYFDPVTKEPATEVRVVPMRHLPAVEVIRYR
jgi:hypothetical protein